MCGIAGIVNTRGIINEPDLAVARSLMHHRGPDDAGTFVSHTHSVGLVSCRLAIIDLSPTAHMPMSSSDGQVTIVYNGEIYNFIELRHELQESGYEFRSNSDTEVVLYSYLEWGDRCVEQFRGMFAFAIWDQRLQAGYGGKVFIARDRLGIKPLYYKYTSGILIFASELKALRALHSQASLTIDPTSVVAYLSMGSVPNPRTIYKDVLSLEPGCTLVLHNAHIKITPYWKLPASVESKLDRREAIDKVRFLLEESVRLHLISDVPLGAFLSGGLDSSVVVSMMCRLSSSPVRTCSMLFKEQEYSEATFARALAHYYNTDHYERVITAQDIKERLEHIIWSMDQPTIDGVNTYFVSQTAHEAGLTVALSGLGGDELFGGYKSTFRGVPRLSRAMRWLHAIPGASALARLLFSARQQQGSWSRVTDALEHAPSLFGAYVACRGLFARNQIRELLTPGTWHAYASSFDAADYVAHVLDEDGTAKIDKRDLFNWVSRAELRSYTHNQLLRDTDVMSMAHSLEVRVPLLDHRLVETVLRMPVSVKQQGIGIKPLLLAATDDILPDLIRARQVQQTKQGFTFPFDVWLRGMLRNWFEDEMHQLGRRDAILRPESIQRVWDGFLRGKVHWSRIWAIGILLAWQRQIRRGVK